MQRKPLMCGPTVGASGAAVSLGGGSSLEAVGAAA